MGGVAKALIESGGQTFLARIASMVDGGIVVVGPPHGERVAEEARRLGLQVATNARPEAGMASSVAIGFAAIAETPARSAWLWPVDHPHVSRETLVRISDALGEHAVARPTYRGRGGHPPLVARRLWPRLVACANLEGGARTVIGDADRVDVEVDDPGCVRDVDTPEDL